MSSLLVVAGLRIPVAEFELTYSRSSGPGGQNVNKVNSKAQLRWPVATSPSLPEGARARFMEKYGSRLTTEGELIIASDSFRDRGRNMQDCFDRLKEMLTAIARPPKIRRATKPTKGSQRRRMEGKRLHSEKKRSRSGKHD